MTRPEEPLDTDTTELTLQRSPAQRRRILLVVLPLAALGLIAIATGFSTPAGPPLMLLGVLLLVPGIWALDQGWVVIRLTPTDLTIRRAGSGLSVRWDEVGRFYIRTVPGLFQSGRLFGWAKVPSIEFREAETVFPRNRRALAGYIAAVGMDPETEVELLETWRRRWSGRDAAGR